MTGVDAAAAIAVVDTAAEFRELPLDHQPNIVALYHRGTPDARATAPSSSSHDTRYLDGGLDPEGSNISLSEIS